MDRELSLLNFYRNMGEALVSKGLATVVRYRQDDDQRASDYDALLVAEQKAKAAQKGLHGKKDAEGKGMQHVIDITGVSNPFDSD